MLKKNYQVGDWYYFALDRGGYALGLVARRTRSHAMLTYIFGPRREAPPGLSDTEGLHAENAVEIMRASDLHLRDMSWTNIGQTSRWQPEKWPMPRFKRVDILRSNRAWQIQYSEKDLLTELGCELIDPRIELHKDCVCGARAVEIHMDRLLPLF